MANDRAVLTLAAAVILVALLVLPFATKRLPPETPPDPPTPRRAAPVSFPPDTHLPNINEVRASGAIDLGTFSPGRDLIRFDDPRIWWESDHDKGDIEDDHSIHKSVEGPLRTLIELVTKEGGELEVHEAYHPGGQHNIRSLHKEGRAIDVTCDQFPLEELAKLCWVAGFDWVYYEASTAGGAHIHCSVKRTKQDHDER